VTVSRKYGLLMGAYRPVSRAKEEDGAASLLSHRDETVVVLDQPQAVGVELCTRKVQLADGWTTTTAT